MCFPQPRGVVQTLRDNEGHFIQQGTLLVLENLFGHVLRTLVKHVYAARALGPNSACIRAQPHARMTVTPPSTTVSNEGKDSAHLLHLDNVLVALRLLGCDFDMDEVECMLATLISKVRAPATLSLQGAAADARALHSASALSAVMCTTAAIYWCWRDPRRSLRSGTWCGRTLTRRSHCLTNGTLGTLKPRHVPWRVRLQVA